MNEAERIFRNRPTVRSYSCYQIKKSLYNEINILKNLRQHFSKIIQKTDVRTKISPVKFVIGLVYK